MEEIKNAFTLEQWDDWYKGERAIHIKPKKGFFGAYDIFLCDTILAAHIPPGTGKDGQRKKICEVGSGDGKLVKKLGRLLGYEPYGIEYSAEGAKMAENQGIKVIQGDAFDEQMLNQYEGYFDVVFSYGFVEHIYPTEKAIEMHLKLLKPGGFLVVQIPRFKGFNYLKVKFFRPSFLPVHNLEIMEQEKLEAVLKRPELRQLYCRNYGTLKLRLPLETKNWKYYLLKFITLADYVLNPLCHGLFGKNGFETRFFSPAVMYIGQKQP